MFKTLIALTLIATTIPADAQKAVREWATTDLLQQTALHQPM